MTAMWMTWLIGTILMCCMKKVGIVDYVVGPKPGPGVFVFAEAEDDNLQKHYLNYGKLGKGPLYSFYVPYHLTILEVPQSIARVALFRDEAIVPQAGVVVDVITVAKTDLAQGESQSTDLGGFKTYGVCENASTVVDENSTTDGYRGRRCNEGAR